MTPAVTVAALDPLFDTDGKVTHDLSTGNDDDGRAVAIQTDGKIVVAGSFRQGLNDYDWAVWRYNPDGTLDTTFGGGTGRRGIGFTADGGATLDHRANAVAIQSDGKIVIGGYSETVTNGRDMTVVRLNTDGSPDTTFDGDSVWTRPTRFPGNDEVTALALQADGQIVLAGWRTFTAPDTDFYVTRLSSTGVIDTVVDRTVAFDLGNNNIDKANAVAIQADGKILVAGSAQTASFSNDIAVARIDTLGNLDTSFDGDGRLTIRFAEGAFTDNAAGVAVQSDGKIVIGGSAQTSSGNAIDFGFVRLNANGTFDTTFDGDGKQTAHFDGNDIPGAMVMQPDGKIVLAGLMIPIGSTDSDPLLVRVNANGTMDTSFDVDGMKRYPFDLGGSNADTLKGVALDASGRIVAVGSAQTNANGTDLAMIRVFGKDIPLVVDTTADGIDGNLASGKLSLREAIALANVGPGADAITFAAGLGPVTLTTDQLSLSDTSGATTVSGPSGGTQVVQRSTAGGTPSFRIFGVSTGVSAVFNNLTVSGGAGGIFNAGTLTLTNSTVSGNVGEDIGGISNAGTLTVTNSTVSGNTVTGGGFLPQLNGGGIYSGVSSTLTVTNSTLSGNTAAGFGGGIFTSGSATLTNVTITGNRSDNNNLGGETGGGLSVGGSSTVTLNNTLIAGNFRGSTGTTRDDASGAAAASSNNLIGDGTNLTGISNGTNSNLIGTGAAPINPLLQPLASNGGVTFTHALGQNSPALGKASATVAGYSVYDQRSTARDLSAPDIGAYEVQHPLAPVGVPTTLATLYAPKPSASANEAFVKGLYQSTLLRAPDPGGQATWVNALNGGTSRTTVANGFINSLENRRNQVTFYYRYFLSREPDAGGLNFWVDRLRGGEDEGSVMTGFILSQEFSGNNNNTQFVNLMYYALLGRQADTAGFNDWMNRLATGTSRATVVRDFLRSEEGLNRVVRSLFQAYLKREADAGAVVNFRTALLSGTTFGQAAISILGGQEFFNNATANMT